MQGVGLGWTQYIKSHDMLMKTEQGLTPKPYLRDNPKPVLPEWCFLMSTVKKHVYQEILSHFRLCSAKVMYGDADCIV